MSTDVSPQMSPKSPSPNSSAQLGLLGHITASAMDGDYAAVARRAGEPRASRGISAGAVLAAFALLVVMAASQTSSSETSNNAARADLIVQLRQARVDLESQQRGLDTLRGEVQTLRSQALGSGTLSARTRRSLNDLGLAAGTTAATGPGLVIEVDDAPGATDDRERVLDMDLQRLVNGLWEAGAEAIAINGQRLGASSAIRQAGSAITVNYDSLTRPYRLRVIGNRSKLPARFAETSSGRAWLDLQRRVHLQLTMRAVDEVSVPAMSARELRHAVRQGGRKGES